MSTHNIAFHKDLTKIIFQLSNMHLISSSAYILNAKNLAPPFLSIFSGSKSMITKINVL